MQQGELSALYTVPFVLTSLVNASMLLLAQSDAIPGVDLSEATRMQKYVTQWPWRMFTTTSVRPNGWMASFRQTALSTYQQLNVALAQ
jgi:protein MBA1